MKLKKSVMAFILVSTILLVTGSTLIAEGATPNLDVLTGGKWVWSFQVMGVKQTATFIITSIAADGILTGTYASTRFPGQDLHPKGKAVVEGDKIKVVFEVDGGVAFDLQYSPGRDPMLYGSCSHPASGGSARFYKEK